MQSYTFASDVWSLGVVLLELTRYSCSGGNYVMPFGNKATEFEVQAALFKGETPLVILREPDQEEDDSVTVEDLESKPLLRLDHRRDISNTDADMPDNLTRFLSKFFAADPVERLSLAEVLEELPDLFV